MFAKAKGFELGKALFTPRTHAWLLSRPPRNNANIPTIPGPTWCNMMRPQSHSGARHLLRSICFCLHTTCTSIQSTASQLTTKMHPIALSPCTSCFGEMTCNTTCQGNSAVSAEVSPCIYFRHIPSVIDEVDHHNKGDAQLMSNADQFQKEKCRRLQARRCRGGRRPAASVKLVQIEDSW